MATLPPSPESDSPADESVEPPITPSEPAPTSGKPRVTRASAAWVATGAALLLLILLIVFILQNSDKVEVHFLGWSGTISLGMALLIAAVGGGVLVAISGVARITQLRRNVRRATRAPASA